jgi:hypothetical protein
MRIEIYGRKSDYLRRLPFLGLPINI